jgi:hypothetical protein
MILILKKGLFDFRIFINQYLLVAFYSVRKKKEMRLKNTSLLLLSKKI